MVPAKNLSDYIQLKKIAKIREDVNSHAQRKAEKPAGAKNPKRKFVCFRVFRNPELATRRRKKIPPGFFEQSFNKVSTKKQQIIKSYQHTKKTSPKLSASQETAQPTVIALEHADVVWWNWFCNDFLRVHQKLRKKNFSSLPAITGAVRIQAFLQGAAIF